MSARQDAPSQGRVADPDLWADVGFRHLPDPLVRAFEQSNWQEVRTQLQPIMDGAITDGAYGRELLQLVLRLPRGLDAVLERYRAAALLDHGDWDGLRDSLAAQPIEPLEISGRRDVIIAGVSRTALPPVTVPHHRAIFEGYEFQLQRSMRAMRRWAQGLSQIPYPEDMLAREDIPLGRHLRFRQLHDTVWLAICEAHAGRLEVAYALAREAQRLGDEGEPMRALAHDVAALVKLGLGQRDNSPLLLPNQICRSTGISPLGAWEMLYCVMPFLELRDDDSLEWSARLGARIAARLASPRGELQGESWRVATDLRGGKVGLDTGLPGLVARARLASPGLRGLPMFLLGYAQHRYDAFREAEQLARRAGNVWLEVSALAWMLALDPGRAAAHRLRRLLDVTAWRRPILVPREVAADAALGMTALGERAESIIELALVADRPTVTAEVITRHIDDPTLPSSLRAAAVNALARIGTVHAREVLAKLAKRPDDVGRTAAGLASRPGPGIVLSEREVEVLTLAAEGLTNRQIADRLVLSPHTIARHLANARAKLGASNRAEAAVQLERARR
ncbi:MAG TPA: LuxR C-terminal-related transcriptional regulator [Candidatus Limnocylindria bacterium]|nr:LuxR C-terminal-related transcriptional regulator [Candidatus Limnocylindria bacterium]